MVSSLEFGSAWVEETSFGDAIASAHLNIVNHGAEADELVAVFSSYYESVLLHTPSAVPSLKQDPVTTRTMRVPAYGSLTVGAYGTKMLLIDPIQPLRPGTSLTLTLRFRNSGDITISLPILVKEQHMRVAKE